MPAKVWLPLLLILGSVSWLAFSNLNKANYFYPVDELPEMGNYVYNHGLKVKGRIVPGTIHDDTKPVIFTIAENEKELVVHYIGEEPLPDMFKERAETVVEGTMRNDGVFEAVYVQAKCASKFEAETPEVAEGYGSESYGPETHGSEAPAVAASGVKQPATTE